MPGRILMFDWTDDQRRQADFKGGSWVDAIPNVHLGAFGFDEKNSVGPDMAFARKLIELEGGSGRVGLVPTAVRWEWD